MSENTKLEWRPDATGYTAQYRGFLIDYCMYINELIFFFPDSDDKVSGLKSGIMVLYNSHKSIDALLDHLGEQSIRYIDDLISHCNQQTKQPHSNSKGQ